MTLVRPRGDGTVALPAPVDLCAVARFPTTPDAEGPAELAAAARAGGFGAMVVAARGSAIDDDARAAAFAAAFPDEPRVIVAASLTRNNGGKELADVATALPGRADGPRVFRALEPVDDTEVLRRALELVAGLRGLAILPSVDGALSRRGVVVEGRVSTRLGLPGVPEAAEAIGTARVVELARLTGCAVHVAGVFTAAGALLVERARADGLPVSGSTTPLQLLLDEEQLLQRRYDSALRVWPPLPTAESRAALTDAVERGVLCIAAGHEVAPVREKALEFAVATPGARTLDVLVPLLWKALGAETVARALAAEPARLAFLPTSETVAGVLVVDPRPTSTVASGPFAGLPTQGSVVRVLRGPAINTMDAA
jgi:dihydroorotase